MQSVKRLEIITGSHVMREVIGVLAANGITSYTLIKDVIGRGERGMQFGDELTDVFANSYLITTCLPAEVDDLVRALRPALEQRGGVCLVSDALWVKH